MYVLNLKIYFLIFIFISFEINLNKKIYILFNLTPYILIQKKRETKN